MKAPRIELDADGRVVRAWVPSSSRPGAEYPMARSVGGRWEHTDTECRGWVEFGHCKHITELEDFTMTDEAEERAITVPFSPLALLDAVELEEVMGAKLVPSERHIYSFRVKGQQVEGVSIDGVRDAARALSTKGEAIRELWARMEREDEREAHFLACSARFAISPNGQEICMDTAIRAKRQPKWGKVHDPKPGQPTEYFIDAWFEIGIAKAARNATEALLPEQLKEWLKAKARELVGKSNNSQRAPTSAATGAGVREAARVSSSQPTAAQSAERRAQQQPRKPEAAAKPSASPKNDVLALLARVGSELDGAAQRALLATLATEHPKAFHADGPPTLSDVDNDEAALICAAIKVALDGVGPEAAPEAQAKAT